MSEQATREFVRANPKLPFAFMMRGGAAAAAGSGSSGGGTVLPQGGRRGRQEIERAAVRVLPESHQVPGEA
eukprot:6118544-Prymnesium_polylepis.1